MAEQHKKLRAQAKQGGGAGRPRKSKAELLADATRMLRNKIMSVEDIQSRAERAFTALFLEADEAFKNGLPDDLAATKRTMVEESAKVVQEIVGVKTALQSTKVDDLVGDGSGAEHVKNRLVDKMRPAIDSQKTMTKLAAQFRAALKLATKQVKKSAGGAAAADDKSLHPLAAACRDFIAAKKQVTSVGVSKTKADDAIAKQVPTIIPPNGEMTKGIVKVHGHKQHLMWTKKQVMKSDALTVGTSEYKAKTATSMKEVIGKHFPLAKFTLPFAYGEVKDAALLPSQLYQTSGHYGVSCNPFGISEFRLLTEGAGVICGVPYDSAAGANLTEKIHNVMSGDGPKLFIEKCVNGVDGSFWFVHQELHTCFFVPGGYLVAHFGLADEADGCSVVRWGHLVQSKEHTEKAIRVSKDLATAFPEAADVALWAEALEKCVLPLF
eukprot:12004914-Alexandrium_andersonii.AAC.1